MIPMCNTEKVGIVSWAPLARGFLARSLEAVPTPRQSIDRVTSALHSGAADIAIRNVVREISYERSASPATVALSWVLRDRVVASATVGVSSLGQLDDAHKALTLQLSNEEIARLEKSYLPRVILDHK